MADLIAQGQDSQCRWRRELPSGRRVVLGRSSGTWAVSWDRKISRQHAEIMWDGETLLIRRLESARNPIYLRGSEQSEIWLQPGESFTVGETTFSLSGDRVGFDHAGPALIQQGTYAFEELQALKFRRPDERIELLGKLPQAISSSTRDIELFVRLGNLLMLSTPHADAVGVIGASVPGEAASLRVLHWDRRPTLRGDFLVRERVVSEALRRSESTVHVWNQGVPVTDSKADQDDDTTVTPKNVVNWAVCIPIPGEQPPTLALYLTGRELPAGQEFGSLQNGLDLTDDLKFTSLVAAHLGALRQGARLARTRSVLSHCFSPMIIERLPEDDPEVILAPRVTEVTVLVCRLRNRLDWKLSPPSEELFEVLERISQVLRIMTYHVLDHGGVMASRHRESALAVWGWPLVMTGAVGVAAQAALGLKTQLEANSHRVGHPLYGFEVNLAFTSGSSLVGKLGTTEQVEVGVFGPPVDQSERLRALGAALRLPILLDEATALLAKSQLPQPAARYRRVVRVEWPEPQSAETIYELLPPLVEFPDLADDHLSFLEAAQDAFEAGRWQEALASLRRVPTEDRVKDFLTNHIARHDGHPPTNWSGSIPWNEVLNPPRIVKSPSRHGV